MATPTVQSNGQYIPSITGSGATPTPGATLGGTTGTTVGATTGGPGLPPAFVPTNPTSLVNPAFTNPWLTAGYATTGTTPAFWNNTPTPWGFHPNFFNPSFFSPSFFNPNFFNPNYFNPNFANQNFANPYSTNPSLFNPGFQGWAGGPAFHQTPGVTTHAFQGATPAGVGLPTFGGFGSGVFGQYGVAGGPVSFWNNPLGWSNNPGVTPWWNATQNAIGTNLAQHYAQQYAQNCAILGGDCACPPGLCAPAQNAVPSFGVPTTNGVGTPWFNQAWPTTPATFNNVPFFPSAFASTPFAGFYPGLSTASSTGFNAASSGGSPNAFFPASFPAFGPGSNAAQHNTGPTTGAGVFNHPSANWSNNTLGGTFFNPLATAWTNPFFAPFNAPFANPFTNGFTNPFTSAYTNALSTGFNTPAATTFGSFYNNPSSASFAGTFPGSPSTPFNQFLNAPTSPTFFSTVAPTLSSGFIPSWSQGFAGVQNAGFNTPWNLVPTQAWGVPVFGGQGWTPWLAPSIAAYPTSIAATPAQPFGAGPGVWSSTGFQNVRPTIGMLNGSFGVGYPFASSQTPSVLASIAGSTGQVPVTFPYATNPNNPFTGNLAQNAFGVSHAVGAPAQGPTLVGCCREAA